MLVAFAHIKITAKGIPIHCFYFFLIISSLIKLISLPLLKMLAKRVNIETEKDKRKEIKATELY